MQTNESEIMGFNVSVYMGYNVKGIKERRASRLSTDPSVEVATAWSSPLRVAGDGSQF